jgi:hypothetical protein
MKFRFSLLTIFTLALVLIGATVAQAQPTPNRVGVVIRVDVPDRFPAQAAEIAAEVLREFRSSLDEARAIEVIEQDTLASAQERLDISLNIDSSQRDLQAVANQLNLDRLVIIDLTLNGRFSVALSAKAFNNDTNRTVAFSARAVSDELNIALLRVSRDLLDDLIPFLA